MRLNLLVYTDGIQSSVHNIDPTVFGREDKEGHQRLPEIVKIVSAVHPDVARISSHAVGSIAHRANVRALAVVETALKQLLV